MRLAAGFAGTTLVQRGRVRVSSRGECRVDPRQESRLSFPAVRPFLRDEIAAVRLENARGDEGLPAAAVESARESTERRERVLGQRERRRAVRPLLPAVRPVVRLIGGARVARASKSLRTRLVRRGVHRRRRIERTVPLLPLPESVRARRPTRTAPSQSSHNSIVPGTRLD